MSRFFKATIIVIIILLGVLTLSSILNPNLIIPNQKVSLKVSNIVIKNSSDYYVIRATVSLPKDIPTLFNCYVKIDYITRNNIWKTITDNLGIINQEHTESHNKRMDGDFMCDVNIRHSSIGFSAYVGSNVNVEAYGYLKP